MPLPCEQAKAAFAEQGFFKLENLFRKELIRELASDLLGHLDLDEGTRIHNRRYIVTVPLKGPFNQPELYANPRLIEVMRAILGPDCILNSVGAVVSLPGAIDQHIHRDYEPLFKERPELNELLPPYAITVGVPLVDIDAINGPTKIWIGSHRAIDKQSVDSYPRHLLSGPIGSCYFWDYRTFHAGGSNHSDQMRPLLYMAYTRRWFKDFLNPDRLVIDLETIPEEHRRLFPIQQKHRDAETEAEFKKQVASLFGIQKQM